MSNYVVVVHLLNLLSLSPRTSDLSFSFFFVSHHCAAVRSNEGSTEAMYTNKQVTECRGQKRNSASMVTIKKIHQLMMTINNPSTSVLHQTPDVFMFFGGGEGERKYANLKVEGTFVGSINLLPFQLRKFHLKNVFLAILLSSSPCPPTKSVFHVADK